MRTASEFSRKSCGQLRLAFRVSDTAVGSFTIGRHGYLIGKNGERVPFKVIICSRTGKGVLELDRHSIVKRA